MPDPNSAPSAVTVDRRLVYLNAASSATARVLNVLILFWAYQYLLRRVSSEEFAIYPIVLAIMAFAPMVTFLFTGGVARFAIEAFARDDRMRVREIVSSVFPVLATAAVLLGPLGVLAAFGIHHVMPIPEDRIADARLMFMLLLANFLLSLLLLPLSVGFQIKQRFVLLNVLEVLKNAARLVLLVALLAGIGPRVLWVVVASVSTDVAVQLIRAWLSVRMVPDLWPSLRHTRLGTARELVGFGFWTSLGQLVSMIHTSAGVLILSQLGTPTDIAVYHVGSMIDRQFRSMASMVVAPVQPAVTAMHATGEQARIGRTYLRGGRYALWIVLLLAVPLCIYSEPFVMLYVGGAYQQAALVIVLLMASYLFDYPTFLLGAVSMAKARVRLFFLAAVATQLIAVALMVAGLWWMSSGAVAVAAAILVSRAVMNLAVFWPFGLRLAGVSVRRFGHDTLLLGIAPAIAGGVIWGALALYHPPQTWLELALFTAIGATAYLALLLTRCLQAQEWADLCWGLERVGALVRLPRRKIGLRVDPRRGEEVH